MQLIIRLAIVILLILSSIAWSDDATYRPMPARYAAARRSRSARRRARRARYKRRKANARRNRRRREGKRESFADRRRKRRRRKAKEQADLDRARQIRDSGVRWNTPAAERERKLVAAGLKEPEPDAPIATPDPLALAAAPVAPPTALTANYEAAVAEYERQKAEWEAALVQYDKDMKAAKESLGDYTSGVLLEGETGTASEGQGVLESLSSIIASKEEAFKAAERKAQAAEKEYQAELEAWRKDQEAAVGQGRPGTDAYASDPLLDQGAAVTQLTPEQLRKAQLEGTVGQGRPGTDAYASDPLLDQGAAVTQLTPEQLHKDQLEAWREQTEAALGQGRPGTQTGASDPLMDMGAAVTQLTPEQLHTAQVEAANDAWRKMVETATVDTYRDPVQDIHSITPEKVMEAGRQISPAADIAAAETAAERAFAAEQNPHKAWEAWQSEMQTQQRMTRAKADQDAATARAIQGPDTRSARDIAGDRIYDTARELLSFGAVKTPTWNPEAGLQAYKQTQQQYPDVPTSSAYIAATMRDAFKQQPALGPLAVSTADTAATLAVPFYGTVTDWNEMSPAMRGASVGFDAVGFIPGLGIAAKAARGTGSAGKAAAAGVRAAGVPLSAADIGNMARLDKVVTGTAAQARNYADLAFNPDAIPLSSIDQSFSTVKIPLSEYGANIGAMEAKGISDTAVQNIIRTGDSTSVQLPDGNFLNVRGSNVPKLFGQSDQGAAAHGTPFPETFDNPGVMESDFFLSTTTHPRFVQATAGGAVNPNPKAPAGTVIFNDPDTLAQGASSNKLYRGSTENELIIPEGVAKPAAPKTRLHTRDSYQNIDRVDVRVTGDSPTLLQKLRAKQLGFTEAMADLNPVGFTRRHKGYDITDDPRFAQVEVDPNARAAAQAQDAADAATQTPRPTRPPEHLLREAPEQPADYREARRRMMEEKKLLDEARAQGGASQQVRLAQDLYRDRGLDPRRDDPGQRSDRRNIDDPEGRRTEPTRQPAATRSADSGTGTVSTTPRPTVPVPTSRPTPTVPVPTATPPPPTIPRTPPPPTIPRTPPPPTITPTYRYRPTVRPPTFTAQSARRRAASYPRTVSWRQGSLEITLDLINGTRDVKQTSNPYYGRPSDTFRVVAYSDEPPGRQRVELGVIDVIITPDGIQFVTDDDMPMPERTVPQQQVFRMRTRGF